MSLSNGSLDTNIRYFTDDIDRDVNRVTKVEYVLEEMAGILKLPERKQNQAKKLYPKYSDRKSYDVAAVAGALLWAASYKHPTCPRWREIVQDACLEVSKNQNMFGNPYSEGYYQKRLTDNISRMKNHVDVSPASGVDMMWEVLKYYERDFPEEDFQHVKTFCMKYMPLLEHSTAYIEDASQNYSSKSKIGLSAALLRIGIRKHVSNRHGKLGLERLCNDLGLSDHRLEDKIESIEDDLRI